MSGGDGRSMVSPVAPRWAALFVFVVALIFYTVSACPVVSWGDSAELSRRALSYELSPIARGYPLHHLLCRFAGVVVGDAARESNLVSALFGALTAAIVFEAARRFARSTRAGVAAALTLGLAHTFWQYSAVAEVYTLHTAILMGAVLLAFAADAQSSRARWGLGALLGLSLLHHRMIFFAVPALVLWLWTGTPRGRRLRAAGQVLGGFALGVVPFAVLCAAASRSPPEGVDSRVLWWIDDVFLGGERNAGFILGAGHKSLPQSAAYLGRFVALNLPGPALVLAVAGLALARRHGGIRAALFLVVMLAAHAWFPLRYDWTGDQYSFLIPMYPILALAVAVAVARLESARGKRAASIACACLAAAPAASYAMLAFTPLGERMLPELTPRAVRTTFFPARTGDSWSRDWCAARLSALPPDVLLHADWGDGQVYLYLQEAEGLRRDVLVDVWSARVKLGDGRGREEWLSVLPFRRELPRAVAQVRERLEPRGEGLFRVLPR